MYVSYRDLDALSDRELADRLLRLEGLMDLTQYTRPLDYESLRLQYNACLDVQDARQVQPLGYHYG